MANTGQEFIEKLEVLEPKSGDAIVVTLGEGSVYNDDPESFIALIKTANENFSKQGIHDLQWIVLPSNVEIKLSLLDNEKVPHPALLRVYEALRARYKFAQTPKHPLVDPQWEHVNDLDDWRNQVPVVFRPHWHALATETRLAIVFMAMSQTVDRNPHG